jgi:hypothetical protein
MLLFASAHVRHPEATVSHEMIYVRISGPSDLSLAELSEYDPPPDGVEFRVRRTDEVLGISEVILIIGIAKNVIEGTAYATLGAMIADRAKGFFSRHLAETVDGNPDEVEFNATIQALDSAHPEREHAVGDATTVHTTRQFTVTFQKTVTREARRAR